MTDSPSIVHQESPHNAEPQLKALIEPSNFYTPLSLAFQRNHSDFISDDHLARWKLQVGIEQAARAGLRLEPSTDLKELEGEELSGVGKRKEAAGEREQVVWTGGLDELKQKGKERTLRACLQCAGLRRDELSSVRKTEGVQWSSSAIANLLWKGTTLRSFLLSLGLPTASPDLDTSSLHVHFESDVGPCEQAPWYGSSITYDQIMSPGSPPFLLAHSVNSETLSPTHGGPLRVVTPGVIGARSVKYLERIIVRTYPSLNFYETEDYKRLPSTATSPSPEERYELMASTNPMEAYGMNLVVGPTVESGKGKVRVRGYAIGTSGIPLERVELTHVPATAFSRPPSESLNTVRSLASTHPTSFWIAASLERGPSEDGDGEREWGWVLWEGELEVDEPSSAGGGVGRGWIVGKCVGKDGSEQRREGEWNLRGVGMEGWSVREIESWKSAD